MKLTQVKKIVIVAVCAALAIVLPMAFHSIPNAGKVWLPMHIPVLLCGIVTGPVGGLAAGVLGPVLSSVLTGMPPAPILPSMTCELAVYGLVAGRLVGGLLQALVFSAGSYSFGAWFAGYFTMSVPGIVLQLVVIVPIAIALERAGLVPARYPRADEQ